MSKEIWYYEYIVKIWGIDHKEEMLEGVVPAESMSAAVADIESYYGNELMEIRMIKPIIEGPVFDFQLAMDEPNFDFVIKAK